MAGRRNRSGYQEYRGRSGGSPVLKFIVALLAALLAAGVLFIVFLGDYIKYTDRGVEIDWPWLTSQPPAPPEPSAPEAPPSQTVEVTVEPAQPSAEPETDYAPIGAVAVTAGQLRGGLAPQLAAGAGGTALVVEMKDIDGRLAWQSQTELAAALGANAADGLTAQAVRELALSGELYLVARVQCFRDPLLSANGIGPLMTRGGNRWHDAQGVGWSSPASAQAADYLSALCQELADMGFDEILLDSAGYPNFGEVHVLAVDGNRPEDLTAPVSAFLERIAGELAERGVCLSVYTDEELLPGDGVYSGLTASVLARHAGRVWLDGRVSPGHYNAELTAAGFDNAAQRIVAPAAAGGDGSWYQ